MLLAAATALGVAYGRFGAMPLCRSYPMLVTAASTLVRTQSCSMSSEVSKAQSAAPGGDTIFDKVSARRRVGADRRGSKQVSAR
jgi:hypothetical protein